MIDREILPAHLRSLFRQMVENGSLNVGRPTNAGRPWAKFHWGHPDACIEQTEAPRIFFYNLEFAETFGGLCLDRVQVSLAFGVQYHCTKAGTFAEEVETLWYRVRRILGLDTYTFRLGHSVALTGSDEATKTKLNPTLEQIGIRSPRVVSSVALQIEGGKILRYQGVLQFDLYFHSFMPFLGGVDITEPGEETPGPTPTVGAFSSGFSTGFA